MYESGPAVMEVNKIKNELEKIKNNALENQNRNYYRYPSLPNSTRFIGTEARKEYNRGLRKIEDFHNHNNDAADNEE
jgi:hypothetical protein